jgi:integrase
VGRAILDKSPADGIPLPTREIARDRVLNDAELTQVIQAAQQHGGPYGGIVEFLALTGQRREEVSQATWVEFDLAQRTWTLPKERTKNGKSHIVHLSTAAVSVLLRMPKLGRYVFATDAAKSFRRFSAAKRRLDALSGVAGWRLHDLRRTCVSGMARLGIAPHVADKVLNHHSGTISGVAAVYQRHDFLAERQEALDRWGAHVECILSGNSTRQAA